ncbi:hypothetical protein RND71_014454 [Anisodus tanguticus]|uniref:Uncharacterized protein n=1 Tax=Anisodus tanguticus TaxID=243964 RepID=A0AAE1SBM1_9SOLA|nr:hypothetical protein RND71_014454 [Anisodus tanguticus]
MSEEEKLQTNTEGIYNPMGAPFYGMIEEVCVMLVDHDEKFVNEMTDLLKSYGYKVTTVDMASTAMSVLSKGKTKIDVMIINANSPDQLSFQLLAQAVSLNIISLFVCDEHNALVAMNALEDGAYLYLKKPLHEEFVKYIWQFVLREIKRREKVRDGLEENRHQINIGDTNDIGNNNIIGEKNMLINIKEQSNNIHETENNVLSNEKYKLRKKRGRKSTKEINEGENLNCPNKAIKHNVCTEWTTDLHAKFMKAVHQLGEGRCFPLEILKLMNVPSLTRMQVASHLQKCRRNNWRAPDEQKSIRHPLGQGSTSGSQQRSSYRKFGTMPRLLTNIPNLQQQQYNRDQTRRGPEFLFSTINTNNIFSRGGSSTQQQLYRPPIQIQPHYFNINNSLNNPFLLTQNNAAVGLQEQHGPLFGMLGSQGLQDPIIGSSNYRSGLAFNCWDHHTQNLYNLDLNAAVVTTYSGSTIMSDTDIENATIHELGAANTNFQQYIGEPNMSVPSNIVAASHVSDTEGCDSIENENYNAYLDFNNMDYHFQNPKPPSANLPNEHDSEFDQVYSDDQVSASI